MPASTELDNITVKGLLSFSPHTPLLAMDHLNVLIGPNASGKSNLLDILSLARSFPHDIQGPLRGSGGSSNWVWHGDTSTEPTLEVTLTTFEITIRHTITFRAIGSDFLLVAEEITHLPDTLIYKSNVDNFTYQVRVRSSDGTQRHPRFRNRRHSRALDPEPSHIMAATAKSRDGELVDSPFPIHAMQSILEQQHAPFNYPEMALLAQAYDQVRFYDTWTFGRSGSLRRAQPADGRVDYLESDYSNLALVLNQFGAHPEVKQQLISGMQELYEGFTNFEVVFNSGSVQIFFIERGKRTVPATRLSDGSFRYLCLLAILYTPNDSSIICLEEPELGLHPDILPILARHLIAASERKQIIVTTHSDILVDALTDLPESVVVFGNTQGATTMNRLEKNDLAVWLQQYRLGELWTSGEIGGNRW